MTTKALTYARNHGFNAWFEGDAIVVIIPWIDAITGETGKDKEIARSFRELRAILGY